MLNENFQALGSLRVPATGIVLEIIRVVDESEVAHSFLRSECKRSPWNRMNARMLVREVKQRLKDGTLFKVCSSSDMITRRIYQQFSTFASDVGGGFLLFLACVYILMSTYRLRTAGFLHTLPCILLVQRIWMVTGRMEIKIPPIFNFWRTVYSHGWCSLPPFLVNKEDSTLSRVLELSNGTLVRSTLKDRKGKIFVTLGSRVTLSTEQKTEVRTLLSQCLRLDEDFSEFYGEAARRPGFRWIPKAGAGRMLRSPTVFEDVVKMICTTNCSWSLTEIMVGNLTSLLGKDLGDGNHSFPGPESMAGGTEAFFRKNVRTGYRSPYLLEFATAVAEGKLDVEGWRSSALTTDELFEKVKTVKGMGDYAAGNILKLLGRYDYLGLDSWVRGKFYELHSRGRKVKDSTIEKHYASLGKWRGMFFWLEMTRYWYDHKFPF